MMAEHIKVNKAVGLTLDVYEYSMDGIYDCIRETAKYLKDDRESYIKDYCNYGVTTVTGMYAMGSIESYMDYKTYPNTVQVRFTHRGFNYAPPYEYPEEVTLEMATEGVPCYIHYKVAYANVTKEKNEEGKSMVTISFYNECDELVIALKQRKTRQYGDIRCKAGKYVLCADILKEKETKSVAGGCFFCDNARYMKEDGIIYLVCDKYKGKIAETEYTGEQYPEYCKRRV